MGEKRSVQMMSLWFLKEEPFSYLEYVFFCVVKSRNLITCIEINDKIFGAGKRVVLIDGLGRVSTRPAALPRGYVEGKAYSLVKCSILEFYVLWNAFPRRIICLAMSMMTWFDVYHVLFRLPRQVVLLAHTSKSKSKTWWSCNSLVHIFMKPCLMIC